jgi:hypothetical protein
MFQPVARIIETGKLLTGQSAEIVRKAQVAAMHEATQFGVRAVKERTPQGVSGAAGGLLSTIQAEVRQRSSGVIGIIGTSSPYGLVVEKGRRPGKGFPPEGSMLRWIEVKMGVSREEAERIEFPIRRAIAKKGTKGAFMFEQTLKEDWQDFQRIFDRHGVTIARELDK